MESMLSAIDGLHWEDTWRIDNGTDSYVVPFPTTRPVNIVFHGEDPFDYGHYGIHLGQEDRLTFLGPSNHTIIAHFIDCRVGSPTRHNRLKISFAPSSSRTLCIPPGVAHAFDGLHRVFTINSYKLYLPDPIQWLREETEWTPQSDVINLPMDASNESLPSLLANDQLASDLYYQLVAQRQRDTIPNLNKEYPFTEDVELDDGSTVRLMLQKNLASKDTTPDWEPIEGIEGVGWSKHLVLWSGPKSGFIPLLDPRPFYIIDHGEVEYSHDAYGIHLGQEDRLTFLGPLDHQIHLTLVDCREGSPSLHTKIEVDFHPNPLKHLVIPNGVAHKFQGLEKVYTLNKPVAFLDADGFYEPGNDVIDWPAERDYYPILASNRNEAPPEYYVNQVMSQLKLMQSPPQHSTPMILLTQDDNGKEVRVALRKRNDVGSASDN